MSASLVLATLLQTLAPSPRVVDEEFNGTEWAARIKVCRAVAQLAADRGRGLLTASLKLENGNRAEFHPSDLQDQYEQTLRLLDRTEGDDVHQEDPLENADRLPEFRTLTSVLWNSWFARHDAFVALNKPDGHMELADACEALADALRKSADSTDSAAVKCSIGIGVHVIEKEAGGWIKDWNAGATRVSYLWRKRACQELVSAGSTQAGIDGMIWQGIDSLKKVDDSVRAEPFFWGALSLAEAIGREKIYSSIDPVSSLEGGPPSFLVFGEIVKGLEARKIKRLSAKVPDGGALIEIHSQVMVQLGEGGDQWRYFVEVPTHNESVEIWIKRGPKTRTGRGIGGCRVLPDDVSGPLFYDQNTENKWVKE